MEMVKDIDEMQQLSSPIVKRLLVSYQDQKWRMNVHSHHAYAEFYWMI